MNEKELDGYKKRLQAERQKLLAEISQDEKPVDFGERSADIEDEEPDQTEEFSNRLAAAGDLKMRLDEIDSAISKIEDGSYGICENCGRMIGKDVLDVDPESLLCKDCKLGK